MTNCNAEKKGNKNMIKNERPSYFAVITADVRYDKRLRANEKLLYGEITALCNKTGECWASNKYFADLYGVTTQAVSKWVTNLRKCGYISVSIHYKDGTKEIDKRTIKLSGACGNVVTNDCEAVTNDLGVLTNDCEGIVQKIKENNTRLNNTNEYINIKESKKEESNNTQNEQVENCTSGIEETNALKEKIKCLKKEIKMLKDNKKERKPKKQTKSYDEQIAEYTQNEELQNALKAFVQMRAFIKKPLTEYGLKLLLNKLSKIGRTDAEKIAIVNRSVEHNWHGFFEIKEETSYQKSAQPEKKYDQNGYESEEEFMKMFYGE